MNDIRQAVATALLERRTKLGLSQERVAGLAGIDVTTVSRLEREAVVPEIETLQKVCRALGIKLSKIIKLSEPQVDTTDRRAFAIDLLNEHRDAFISTQRAAEVTGNPFPMDTRAWSQIIVSVLTDIKGPARKKGSDLVDGSDVKGACVWGAIDTPRFNGVIKAGRKSRDSGNISYLDKTPYLFLVLWDTNPDNKRHRCRIWVVSPQRDENFRNMASAWYEAATTGNISSPNFQLHPPRNKNSDEIRNTYGNLKYPLLFSAEFNEDLDTYEIIKFDNNALSEATSP